MQVTDQHYVVLSRYIKFGFIIISVLVVLLTVFNPLALSLDSALYLEIGRYLLEGRVPYVDYLEINPPLIHYLNVIPVALAELLNLHAIFVYKVLILVLMAYGAMMSASIFSKASHIRVRSMRLIVPLGIVLGTALTLYDYGQRDHIIAIVLMPWLAFRFLRYEDDVTLPVWQMVILGIFAGIGIALRPYYLLALALPELYFLIKYRKLGYIFRPETIAFGLVGVLYLGHFFLLPSQARETFFQELIPHIQAGYDAYTYPGTNLELFLTLYQWPIILLVTALIWYKSSRDDTPLVVPFLLFSVGAMIVFMYQGLGFEYHKIPLVFSALIAFGFAIYGYVQFVRSSKTSSAGKSRLDTTIVLIAVCVLAIFYGSYQTNLSDYQVLVSYTNRVENEEQRFAKLIAEKTAPDDAVFIITPTVYPAYPLLPQMNRRSDMTYLPAYPIAFDLHAYGDRADEIQEATFLPERLDQYLQVLATDVEVYKPELILFEASECVLCPPDFDIHRMVLASGLLDEILDAHYVRLPDETLNNFAVYERLADVDNTDAA